MKICDNSGCNWKDYLQVKSTLICILAWIHEQAVHIYVELGTGTTRSILDFPPKTIDTLYLKGKGTVRGVMIPNQKVSYIWHGDTAGNIMHRQQYEADETHSNLKAHLWFLTVSNEADRSAFQSWSVSNWKLVVKIHWDAFNFNWV